MRGSQAGSRIRTELSFRKIRNLLRNGLLLLVVPQAAAVLSGCSGSANNASNASPSSALSISNVQAAAVTTSTSQIFWTTNVAANSAVDYGTSPSYGSGTPVDSAMVTTHQVTLSGLAAALLTIFKFVPPTPKMTKRTVAATRSRQLDSAFRARSVLQPEEAGQR
jgi:hypothetical protein